VNAARSSCLWARLPKANCGRWGALARLGICLCVTAALGSFRTYFDSWVNPFDLLGAVKSCGAGHYAAFRGSIARTLDAVRTARYERTLAPSSSLDNS
jgi:hypothetical protein